MNKIFYITGIHTHVGKTITAAVLTEALEADYWKPIQTGFPPDRDSERVKKLISNPHSRIHPEAFLLKEPISPHAAAQKENIPLSIHALSVPSTPRPLIIETAGGLLSPIDEHHTMADLARKWNIPIILVVQFYLGSINHTLLCLEYLDKHKLPFAGIIISGQTDNTALEFILTRHKNIKVLGNIPFFPSITRESVYSLKNSFSFLLYL